MYPPEVFLKIFEYIPEKSIKSKDCFRIEDGLIKLLKSTLVKYPEHPKEIRDSLENDSFIIELLCISFDNEMKVKFPEIEIPEQTVEINGSNVFLLSCCKNPGLMDDIICQIMLYLNPDEPYYYEYTQLSKALDDYEKDQKTDTLKGESKYHELE